MDSRLDSDRASPSETYQEWSLSSSGTATAVAAGASVAAGRPGGATQELAPPSPAGRVASVARVGATVVAAFGAAAATGAAVPGGAVGSSAAGSGRMPASLAMSPPSA